MKKIFLIVAFISLLFTTNVIYARQTNCPQKFCDVENCLQTGIHYHNQYDEYNCDIEECPQRQRQSHNTCRNRNSHHNQNMRHH